MRQKLRQELRIEYHLSKELREASVCSHGSEILLRDRRVSTAEGIDEHVGAERNADHTEAGSAQLDRLAEQDPKAC